jgi:energy-coupling factor transporter ATP-binding protein EcfA2
VEHQRRPDAILLESLSYRYGSEKLALRSLDLAIPAGQCVALVGPNGAGKSTLLLHLNGILPEPQHRWFGVLAHEHGDGGAHNHGQQIASSGTVCIDGIRISKSTAPEIRRRVGLVFQDPDDQLFAMTVLEDVAFGPLNHGLSRTEAFDLARNCLEQVGLSPVAHRSPHHLSFGERKRVCLAGVLACRPTILVMDEPTANLDPRARRRFIELIAGLPMTKFLATHDLEMVLDVCDRAVLLDDGAIVADDLPEKVLSDRALVEKHGLEVPTSLAYRSK